MRSPFAASLLLICAVSSAQAGSDVVASKAALSTSSPQATSTGLAVLKNGGNAIDAAVAVAMTLAVVHPQAGNLGGGGFLVYYDAKSKGMWSLDFRETASGAAKRDMYRKADGSISPESLTGPRSAATPGSVAGLETMHKRFGKLPWSELLQPALHLAREGFLTGVQLTSDLEESRQKRRIDQYPSTAAIFYPQGKPLPPGSHLVQRDLAATLERLAKVGAKDFYSGELASKLVKATQSAGGILLNHDLRDYQPVWRAPIRVDFGDYAIYTVAPPSGGGLVIGETLNILSGYPLERLTYQSPAAVHLIVEAERRAYIDRNKYIGDPATVRIPYAELLSSERAKLWRASIDPKHSTPTSGLTEPGTNPMEGNHTTHFTIVDEAGDVASLTTTLNENFGSGFVVPGLGFFLNDEMDDFTTVVGKPNVYSLIQGNVNAIEPGKRMASSMSPTIVMRGGAFFLALGSPGGATIPTTVLQVLLNVLVWHKTLVEAVAAPRYHQQALPEDVYYERGRAPKSMTEALGEMGHGVSERGPIGDVHAVMSDHGRLIAVADPRSEGAAGGY